jgi:hypothetical protein
MSDKPQRLSVLELEDDLARVCLDIYRVNLQIARLRSRARRLKAQADRLQVLVELRQGSEDNDTF